MQASLSFFKQFIDFLLPLRCVKCGLILEQGQGLCASCWVSIPFISKPFCECCGLPFDFPIEEGALCGVCSHSPPPYKTARSVFVYTAQSKDLILRYEETRPQATEFQNSLSCIAFFSALSIVIS